VRTNTRRHATGKLISSLSVRPSRQGCRGRFWRCGVANRSTSELKDTGPPSSHAYPPKCLEEGVFSGCSQKSAKDSSEIHRRRIVCGSGGSAVPKQDRPSCSRAPFLSEDGHYVIHPMS
jgi:hypothetical protein